MCGISNAFRNQSGATPLSMHLVGRASSVHTIILACCIACSTSAVTGRLSGCPETMIVGSAASRSLPRGA